MFTVAVLGAVEARRDGERLSVPAGETTELPVQLAIRARASMSVNVAVEDPW